MKLIRPKIAIVDYGLGNLCSLLKAIRYFNVDAVVTEEPEEIERADAIFLPGVGAFAAGMRGLELRGLIEVLKKVAGQNKPMLGICLGAQMMLGEGYEFGVHKGLDIIKGQVTPFPSLGKTDKVPHVGWNTLDRPDGTDWKDTILDRINDKNYVYFVHSYIMRPDNADSIFAFTTYGGYRFCSIVRKNNIYGCQFHPEKSGLIGLSIIENFVKLL